MAHKSLIGGTVYEKYGGADLINGTVYQKNYGKTLIGGTVYEVGFSKPVTITVTGEGLEYYVWLEHNGTVYYAPATFTANVGDVIRCSIEECWSTQYVYLNGEWVDGSAGENDIYYDYVVKSDATIELYHNGADTKRERDGEISITET